MIQAIFLNEAMLGSLEPTKEEPGIGAAGFVLQLLTFLSAGRSLDEEAPYWRVVRLYPWDPNSSKYVRPRRYYLCTWSPGGST